MSVYTLLIIWSAPRKHNQFAEGKFEVMSILIV